MSFIDARFLQLKNQLVKHQMYCVKFVAHKHGVGCCERWLGGPWPPKTSVGTVGCQGGHLAPPIIGLLILKNVSKTVPPDVRF